MNLKKFYPWLLSLLAVPTFGANVAISNLPVASSITADDIFEMTDDPAGSKVSRSITAAKIFAAALASDSEIACISALSSSANKLIYFTGSGTCALTDVSAFIRTLLDDADAATARGTLGLVIGTNVQASDGDLSAIAALTPTNDDVMQYKSGAWANRTLAQFETDLGLVIGTDVEAWDADLDIWATKTAPSGVVVGTTDSQTLTNKTITSPAITTPTGIVKGDVGLGNVDNTSDATKNAAVATLTNKSISGGQITSAVATATALAANGTNCSAGSYALGVDASGNAEGCTAAGTGDASTNTSSSVDSEIALFSSTTGKLLKRATGTGLARTASGVFSASELSGDITTSGSNVVTIEAGAVTDAKASLAVKPAVTVVATTNQALTGTPTIDSVATAAGSIALLTAQTTGAENGPWVVAAGAWSRPSWYPSGGTTQAFQFITTLSRLGTIYGGSTWRITSSGAVTIDTTATTWAVTPHVLNTTTTVGLPVAANPSASIGLTAVNGSASTFTRSDAAPALDQSIAPTWTGLHSWSSAEPRLKLIESDQSTDLMLWDFDINGAVLTGRTRTNADGAGKNWLSVTRGATTAISNVSLGNASDNNTFTFLGSGLTSMAGGITSTGTLTANRFIPTSATAPNVGVYAPAGNTIGLSTNSTLKVSWDINGLLSNRGNVQLTNAGNELLIKEGSNAAMGTCTLVLGTCTVSNTLVTANSRIFLTAQSLGTVSVGQGLAISARSAGTSFTILSQSATDTSVIAWMIVEPAP